MNKISFIIWIKGRRCPVFMMNPFLSSSNKDERSVVFITKANQGISFPPRAYPSHPPSVDFSEKTGIGIRKAKNAPAIWKTQPTNELKITENGEKIRFSPRSFERNSVGIEFRAPPLEYRKIIESRRRIWSEIPRNRNMPWLLMI